MSNIFFLLILEFGKHPERIGIGQLKKIRKMNKTIVKNEIESFELNKLIFVELTKVF